MAKRIDGLAVDNTARLDAFTGALLRDELDEELQALVREAGEQTGTPIALVSLVLNRTQFFRAHVGLPDDLAVSRATDRTASFCQFVVRDGVPFVTTDAAGDPRVPQELVERYGVRAYCGVPVQANQQVVGSLCVIDTKTRDFTPSDHEVLRGLQKRVNARLDELARVEDSSVAGRPLFAEATKPLFAELRNQLVPFGSHAIAIRMAIADLGPLVRLTNCEQATENSLAVLSEAARAFEDLEAIAEEQDRLSTAMIENFAALERLAQAKGGALLADVLNTSLRLAHHHTKLVGGVVTPAAGAVPPLEVCSGDAAAVLSCALSELAIAGSCARDSSPIEMVLSFSEPPAECTVEVKAPAGVDDDEVKAVLDKVRAISVGSDGISLSRVGSSILVSVRTVSI